MARWNDVKDVVNDLDVLSGIKSSETGNLLHASWGRGQNHHMKTQEDFKECTQILSNSFQSASKKEVLQKFPDSISRGKKLEILKTEFDRESEIQGQLRAVMGPGHSNAFIEESFREQLKLRQKNDLQFEDSEENSPVEKTDNPNETIDSLQVPTPEVKSEGKTQPKRKRLKYRNAVIDSLEKKFLDGEDLENSHSTSVQAFGNDSSRIPPACYVPTNFLPSHNLKERPNTFQYNLSEFPELG